MVTMRKEKRKYSERRQYLILAVHKRRKKIRQMAVEYKGGECEMCGYSRCMEALEFHHKNPSQKDFGISSQGYTRSWKKVQDELDKCVMLCANCHRELHAKLAALSGNTEMKKWAKSGKPLSNGEGHSDAIVKITAKRSLRIGRKGNPELALFPCVRGSSDAIVKITPKQSLRIGRKGKCRDFTPTA